MELNRTNLLSVLDSTNNYTDRDNLAACEHELTKWRSVAGFHALLQTIYLDTHIPMAIRCLAAIHFKNSIALNWRSNHVVTQEEKNVIRSRAFGLRLESNRSLGFQNAYAIAKIARIDFPDKWPNLLNLFETEVLSFLDHGPQSADDLLSLYNSLDIFNQIFKGLSSVKFGKVLKGLQAVRKSWISRMAEIYFHAVKQWMHDFDSLTMEIGYKALKITCRLIYICLKHFSENEETSRFLMEIRTHLAAFIQLFQSHPSELLEKYIKQLCKFFKQLQLHFPVEFILMPSFVDLDNVFFNLIENNAEKLSTRADPNDEKDDIQRQNNLHSFVVIEGFNLMSDQMRVIKSKGTNLKGGSKDARDQCVRTLKDDFFNMNMRLKLISVLVEQYLKISPAELKSIQESPEEFYCYEKMDEKEHFEIRPAVERLISHMLLVFPDIVEHCISFIQEALNRTENQTLQDCALQLLHLPSPFIENVSFHHFFPHLVALKDSQSSLFRRRFCLIISRWSYRAIIPDEAKPHVYSIIVNDYLSKADTDDILILMSATDALNSLISDFRCNVEAFKSLSSDACIALFILMNRLETTECKATVLDTFGVFLNVLKSRSSLNVETILKFVFSVWQEAGDRYPVKKTVLDALQNIVGSMPLESDDYSYILPIIVETCNPETQLSELFAEDGFLLWEKLMGNCSDQFDPRLIQLLFSLVEFLKKPDELFKKQLEILEKYIVWSLELNYEELPLPLLAGQLFSTFQLYFADLHSELQIGIMNILNCLTIRMALKEYSQQLAESSLLKLLVSIFPNDVTQRCSLDILRFFARLAISDANQFCSMIGSDADLSRLFLAWLKPPTQDDRSSDMKLFSLAAAAIIVSGYSPTPDVYNKFALSWQTVLEKDDWCDDKKYSSLDQDVSWTKSFDRHTLRKAIFHQRNDPIYCSTESFFEKNDLERK